VAPSAPRRPHDVYVWDQTAGKEDMAHAMVPENIRAGGKSGPVTLFIVHKRDHVEVGRYNVSRQPAYREYLEVAAVHWPEQTCVGSTRLDGGPPPARRPVQYVPGYGASVSLSNWIESLKRER
jgi:hypothetical protein